MEDLNPMRTKITGGNYSSIIQAINQYWFKISNKITELNKKKGNKWNIVNQQSWYPDKGIKDGSYKEK